MKNYFHNIYQNGRKQYNYTLALIDLFKIEQ